MIYILSVGSNLGNKINNIKTAIKLIASKLIILKSSSIFETRALIQKKCLSNYSVLYYNLVLIIKSDIYPRELLKILKLIELKIGRKKCFLSWFSRIIDLDIILEKKININYCKLCIPHKLFLKRDFFLIPSSEICINIMVHNFIK